ncbi:MAG: DUF4124 domain-containing protein [Colwellia sp.]|nr:DUF4124 domain-containing protein [Colwellia sp.]
MNIRHSVTIALWLAVILSTNVIAKDIAIYRWVDENNVVHFSQHQPQTSNYSQLTTFSSYKARKEELPEQAKLPSVDEQLAKYEQEKADIQAKNKKIAETNCKAAQLNEKMLNSFDKVMVTGPDGKNKTLSKKETKAQLALSKKHINMYCEQSKS